MDERFGVREARRLGLRVTGTLGILVRGAEREFVKLGPGLQKLQRTNFRVSPQMIDQLLRENENRS